MLAVSRARARQWLRWHLEAEEPAPLEGPELLEVPEPDGRENPLEPEPLEEPEGRDDGVDVEELAKRR